MGQIPVNAGEKQAFPPVDSGALARPLGSQPTDAGPRHDQAVTVAGPSASRPESGDGLKRPRPGRSGPPIEASGRRITQKMVNLMADLRRQGFTFKDIAARVGCSERTVRRYVGHVATQVEAPPDGAPPDLDAERIRAQLIHRFTPWLEDEFEVCRSVTLIDEANRRLEARLARTHPETLGLLEHNQNMQWQFFCEIVGPLEHDLRRSDPTGRVGATEDPPVMWHPLAFPDEGTLTWQPEPEPDNGPSNDALGRGEGLP